MNPRSITDADRQLAKRLTGNLTEINSILAGWDRLIPAAVIGAAYRGDGYSPRGDGGRGSGISDPTAGQMSSAANALELGAQLFGGQLGYPGEWPRMLDWRTQRPRRRLSPPNVTQGCTCPDTRLGAAKTHRAHSSSATRSLTRTHPLGRLDATVCALGATTGRTSGSGTMPATWPSGDVAAVTCPDLHPA